VTIPRKGRSIGAHRWPDNKERKMIDTGKYRSRDSGIIVEITDQIDSGLRLCLYRDLEVARDQRYWRDDQNIQDDIDSGKLIKETQ
jgi:hypothetical protein